MYPQVSEHIQQPNDQLTAGYRWDGVWITFLIPWHRFFVSTITGNRPWRVFFNCSFCAGGKRRDEEATTMIGQEFSRTSRNKCDTLITSPGNGLWNFSNMKARSSIPAVAGVGGISNVYIISSIRWTGGIFNHNIHLFLTLPIVETLTKTRLFLLKNIRANHVTSSQSDRLKRVTWLHIKSRRAHFAVL